MEFRIGFKQAYVHVVAAVLWGERRVHLCAQNGDGTRVNEPIGEDYGDAPHSHACACDDIEVVKRPLVPHLCGPRGLFCEREREREKNNGREGTRETQVFHTETSMGSEQEDPRK